MTHTAVLIPHRSDDSGHRDTNLSWVTHQWKTHFPEYDLHVGTHTHGPWDKAAAVNDALAHTRADTLIISDNDVWTHDPDDVLRAVHACQDTGWALPHTYIYRLNPHATRTYTRAPHTNPRTLRLDRTPYRGVMCGGLFVIRTDLYRTHGGLDPRFLGHTGQDFSFGFLLQTLVGNPWRGRSDLVHLHHPENPAKHDPNLLKTNRALLNRYHRLRHNRVAMAKLAEETRRTYPTPEPGSAL